MRVLPLLALAAGAAATFRGVVQCQNGARWTGNTAGYTNSNYNPAPDAYYDIQLGVGLYRFNSCGSGFDTWLRLIPGRFQTTGGYAACAAGSNVGVGCASCDDCGSCGWRTILDVRIVQPGWYTFLVEGYASGRGAYGITFNVLEGSCSAGFNPTSAPTVTTSPPTRPPTNPPTSPPTRHPTQNPTMNPTKNPTVSPSMSPSHSPTTNEPTSSPTTDPCRVHTCSFACDGVWPGVESFDGEEKKCGWSFSSLGQCLTVDNVTIWPTEQQTKEAFYSANGGGSEACAPFTTTTPTTTQAPGRAPGKMEAPGQNYKVGDTGVFTGGSGTGRTFAITSVSDDGRIQAFEVTEWGDGYSEDDVLTFTGAGDNSASVSGMVVPAEVQAAKDAEAAKDDDLPLLIIIIAAGSCVCLCGVFLLVLLCRGGSSSDPYYYDEVDRPGAVVAFENPQYADTGNFKQGGDEGGVEDSAGDGLYDEPDMAQDGGYMDTAEDGDEEDGNDAFDESDAEASEDESDAEDSE